LLHTSNAVFKNSGPPSDFWPLLLVFGPLLLNPGDGPAKIKHLPQKKIYLPP